MPIQQPLVSSSTGMSYFRHKIIQISIIFSETSVVVPEALLEELAELRFAFAKLLRKYEKQLLKSSKAQEEFVKFLPRLFHRAVDDHSFQSHFNTLVEEELSLFNIFYLKRICAIFPKDVR